MKRGARRAAVLEAIKAHIAEVGYPPTLREIATRVGVHSSGTIAWHLQELQMAGLIEIAPDTARGIRVISSDSPAPSAGDCDTSPG